MKKILLTVLIWGIFAFPVSVLAGSKIHFNDDRYLIVSFLGQMHYQFLENAADENDFFLRRGRIILIGQLTDGIKMFLKTDNDKHGVNGSSASSTDIQDIFIDVRKGVKSAVGF